MPIVGTARLPQELVTQEMHLLQSFIALATIAAGNTLPILQVGKIDRAGLFSLLFNGQLHRIAPRIIAAITYGHILSPFSFVKLGFTAKNSLRRLVQVGTWGGPWSVDLVPRLVNEPLEDMIDWQLLKVRQILDLFMRSDLNDDRFPLGFVHV